MNSQMLSSLNEHMIDIKLIKEKKYERTCVSGLHNFMSQSDIVILTSFIQKNFWTARVKVLGAQRKENKKRVLNFQKMNI